LDRDNDSPKLRLHLRPDQRSDEALRSILDHLLTTIRAKVGGVLDDLDVEFLHDLRVATRRTRSALTQLEGVLPAVGVDRFASEFRWLGGLTGPCRDLDVCLLEIETYRSMLPEEAEALALVEQTIEEARRKAHQDLCDALRSDRFARLLEDWEQFLSTETPDDERPPHANRTIRDLASVRILKAYRRMVKRGNGLGDDPPAGALHRLRIDAKKLRYLLEFFMSLYPKNEVDPLVRELKKLQDILGGFNDMKIQQAWLVGCARDLSSSNSDHAETLNAMGRFAALLNERQEEYRHVFSGRFGAFAGDQSRTRYRSLFKAGG